MGPALGRRLWIIVGLALLLTVVLVFISQRRPPPRVAVVDVVRQTLTSVISTNGKIEPVKPYQFRALIPALVTAVYATEGQQVKRGQLLFTLDDKSVRASLDEARAGLAAEEQALRAAQGGGRSDLAAKLAGDLAKAQAGRDQLQRDHDALAKLEAQHAATPQEVQDNRVALVRAEADLAAAEKAKSEFDQQARLDAAREQILVDHFRSVLADLEEKVRSTHAVAPVDGTLYSLPIRVGDFVHPGDPLAEMADLHEVRVRAFIDQPDLGQLAPGQAVDTTWDAHPDRVWSGRTEVIPKQVVPHLTRNVGELLCSISNQQLELIPNTTVDVRIHLNEKLNVLVIPRGAVLADGGKRYAFVVQDGRLHRREIHVGMSNATLSEVTSGLNENEVVALPGEVRLKDNLRVTPVPPE